MKLFVILFFLLVNLFMSVSINAEVRLHLPNNEKVDGFRIHFAFVHNGKFFAGFEGNKKFSFEFENIFFHGSFRCPPETEFPKYPQESYHFFPFFDKREQRERYENKLREFSRKTCQEQAPEIRDDDFLRRRRHAFISTCMDFVRYCNNGSFHVYTNNEIDAAIEMLEEGITHNANQFKHQEKALVKNINRLKETVKSEVENDLTPLFSRLMDKIADLEAKVNQLEQENRKKDIEITILKEAVAKENAPQ